MHRTVEALEKLGKTVIIFAGIPEIGWDTPTILAKSAWRNRFIEIAPTRQEHELRQRKTNDILASLHSDRAIVLYPDKLLCPGARCRITTADSLPEFQRPLYIDEDHLSGLGVSQLYSLIEQALPTVRQ